MKPFIQPLPCSQRLVSSVNALLAVFTLAMLAFPNRAVAQTTVFGSGISQVTTWDPIFPAQAFPDWTVHCGPEPLVGPNADWKNSHPAEVFAKNSHPWEYEAWVPAAFKFDAHWINAWRRPFPHHPLESLGPGGHSWTKYSTTVTGEGSFVLQFLADNCSWIYLDGVLIGHQDDKWYQNGTGRFTINLTGAGPHDLVFIILDGGGLAGGKFRLETTQSFQQNNPGAPLPPPPPDTPPTISNSGGPVSYVENAAPVPIAPSLTVKDPDGPNLTGAKVAITAGFDSAQDVLSFTGSAGITGSYNASSGVLSLSGSATAADYQTVLRSVTYSNSSENPSSTPRTVTFSVGESTLFFADNGHYYEFVSSAGIRWDNARTAAAGKTLFGLQGYLATITSAAENAFVTSKLQGVGWIGGTDEAAEGAWRWATGPEAGTQFWQGLFPGAGGSAVGGQYSNWNSGEPNNAGNEDYAHMIFNPAIGPKGSWNDLPIGGGGGDFAVVGYLVEYGGTSGDPVLQLTATATVNVVPVNDPPTISDIANQSVPAGGSTGLLPFTVGDFETPAANLVVSASSSNPNVVPVANIFFGGSGASRTIFIATSSGACGSTTITVTVSDGSASASDSIVVTALDNKPPTLSCSPASSVAAGANCSGLVPNVLPGVIASDNCTPSNALTLTQSPAAGTAVGLGNHVITVTAIDAAGNSAQCQTTLLVVPGVSFSHNVPDAFPSTPFLTCIIGNFQDPSRIQNWKLRWRGSGPITVPLTVAASAVNPSENGAIKATVTDETGLKTVTVAHSASGDTLGSLTLDLLGGKIYDLSIERVLPASGPEAHHYKLGSPDKRLEIGFAYSLLYLEHHDQAWAVNAGPNETVNIDVLKDSPAVGGAEPQATSMTYSVRRPDCTEVVPSTTIPVSGTISFSAGASGGVFVIYMNPNGHFALRKNSGCDGGFYALPCPPKVQLACPANIVQPNDPGKCGANVSFSATATGACASAVTYSHSPGSFFPVGTTTVTAKATDAFGVTATCSFTVTVKDTQPPVLTLNGTGPLSFGTVATYFTSVPGGPALRHGHGIAYDYPRNTVWVTDTELGNDIFEFLATQPPGATLSPITRLDVPATAAIEGISFDPTDETLWYVTEDGIVRHITRSGTLLGSFTSGIVPAYSCAIVGSFIWIDNGSTSFRFTKAGLNTGVSMNTRSFGIGYDPDRNLLWTSHWGSGSKPHHVFEAYNADTGALVFNSGTFNLPNGNGLGHNITYGAGKLWLSTETLSQDVIYSIEVKGGVGNLTAECHAPFTDPGAKATDNCDGDLTSSIVVNSNVNPNAVGTYTITYQASDSSGNSSTISRTVTVLDTTPPVLSGPASLALTTDPGKCTATAVYPHTATDLCGSVTLEFNPPAGSALSKGATTVSVKATDSALNITLKTFTVTVTDAEKPIISCPGNIIVQNTPGTCAAPVQFVATATDNCPGVSVSYSHAPGSIFPSGTTVVSATATDASGNKSTCNFTVTVKDAEAPILSGVPGDAVVECTAVPSPAKVTVSDNCDVKLNVLFTEDAIPGSCPGNFVLKRTWTATDASGNSRSATQTITVQDTTAPVLSGVPASVTVECDAVPAPAAVTATDNCGAGGNFALQFDGVSGRYVRIPDGPGLDGHAEMTLEAWVFIPSSSPGGNTFLRKETAYLLEFGTAGINNGLGTHPQILLPWTSVYEGTPISKGQWVHLAVVYNGTTSTLYRNGVADVSAPRTGSVANNGNAIFLGSWGETFNGLADEVRIWSVARTPAQIAASMNTELTGTESGLVAYYNFNDGPGSTILSDLTAGGHDGSLTGLDANLSWVAGAPVASASSGGGVVVTFKQDRIDGNCPGNYTLKRTWTATDACGNNTSGTQTITVQDTKAPALAGVPQDITVECDAVPAPASPTASDNCDSAPIVTLTETRIDGNCPSNYTLKRTWTATDNCGNSSSGTQTVTVQDTQAPLLAGVPPNITVECDAVPKPAAVTAADNCDSAPVVSFNEVRTNGNCPSNYTLIRTWIALDACGNKTHATQTITVQDTTAPVLGQGAKDLIVECDGLGNTIALKDWLATNGGATAKDNCGPVTWSHDFKTLTDECGATGSAKVTFTATDECGNATRTTATFTIQDTKAPVIDVAAVNLTVECDGAGNLNDLKDWLASNGGAKASDICSGVKWSNNFTALSDLCGATGSAIVIFTATDECGNATSTKAIFTIQDTKPPVIDVAAANLTVECDGAGNLTDLKDWLASNGGAKASDICSGVTWSNNFTTLSDECGGTGSAVVTFTATDDCGNSSSTAATFKIIDTTVPNLTWKINGVTVDQTIKHSMTPNQVPVTVSISAADICGQAALKPVRVTCHTINGAGKIVDKSGSCVITINGGTVTIVDSGGVGNIITIYASAVDECGNMSAEQALVIEVKNPGQGGGGTGNPKPKGNEGVGNGVDGNTPGHDNNGGNDDPQFGPGNPGAKNKK